MFFSTGQSRFGRNIASSQDNILDRKEEETSDQARRNVYDYALTEKDSDAREGFMKSFNSFMYRSEEKASESMTESLSQKDLSARLQVECSGENPVYTRLDLFGESCSKEKVVRKTVGIFDEKFTEVSDTVKELIEKQVCQHSPDEEALLSAQESVNKRIIDAAKKADKDPLYLNSSNPFNTASFLAEDSNCSYTEQDRAFLDQSFVSFETIRYIFTVFAAFLVIGKFINVIHESYYKKSHGKCFYFCGITKIPFTVLILSALTFKMPINKETKDIIEAMAMAHTSLLGLTPHEKRMEKNKFILEHTAYYKLGDVDIVHEVDENIKNWQRRAMAKQKRVRSFYRMSKKPLRVSDRVKIENDLSSPLTEEEEGGRLLYDKRKKRVHFDHVVYKRSPKGIDSQEPFPDKVVDSKIPDSDADNLKSKFSPCSLEAIDEEGPSISSC